MYRLLAQESKEPIRLLPFLPGVLPTPSQGGKTTLPCLLLSLPGSLVGGNWRSQTSFLDIQQRGNIRESLSVPNHSHPSHLSGVKKNLLGALEAPAPQAAAAPGVRDAHLYSASLGGIPSLLRVRYEIWQTSVESCLLYSCPWTNYLISPCLSFLQKGDNNT